jgi:hypothetical protein
MCIQDSIPQKQQIHAKSPKVSLEMKAKYQISHVDA